MKIKLLMLLVMCSVYMLGMAAEETIPSVVGKLRVSGEGTVDTSGAWNSNITNLSVTKIDGNILVRFDFNLESLRKSAEFLSNKALRQGKGNRNQILIRMFDERGNYLNHIVSRERYNVEGLRGDIPAVYARPTSEEIAHFSGGRILTEGYPTLPLVEKGNVLVYPASKRDLDYCKIVEFQFAQQ